jgi:uncharacterized Zn ribbon protein
MPTLKTLVCRECGKEWCHEHLTPHCEVPGNGKHDFVELNVECGETPNGNTLVCSRCGIEWSDAKPECGSSGDKKHDFVEVEIVSL